MSEEQDTGNLLDAREGGERGSPTSVAIRHLKRRNIAMVCFFILVGYFSVTIISYLRFPDGERIIINNDGTTSVQPIERRFIGEWFEELATRRLVGPDETPLEYQPPSLTGPVLAELEGRGYSETDVPLWESLKDKEAVEASRLNFIFGTDVQGRSVFWITLYSARTSISIAFGAAMLVVIIGVTLGSIAGYFGGLVDVIITWLFTTVASIPRILLVLAMAYAFRDYEFTLFGLWEDDPVKITGIPLLILAMGLTSWVGLCRLIRGEVMKLKELDYESAARAIGMSRPRILIRHLLPNVLYLVIIQFSLIFPLFIHLEVILSYLGLGVGSSASWGQMIEASLQELMRSPVVWWQLTAATIAVFGVSLALNLFGDALRDALDPKLQQTN